MAHVHNNTMVVKSGSRDTSAGRRWRWVSPSRRPPFPRRRSVACMLVGGWVVHACWTWPDGLGLTSRHHSDAGRQARGAAEVAGGGPGRGPRRQVPGHAAGLTGGWVRIDYCVFVNWAGLGCWCVRTHLHIHDNSRLTSPVAITHELIHNRTCSRTTRRTSSISCLRPSRTRRSGRRCASSSSRVREGKAGWDLDF